MERRERCRLLVMVAESAIQAPDRSTPEGTARIVRGPAAASAALQAAAAPTTVVVPAALATPAATPPGPDR